MTATFHTPEAAAAVDAARAAEGVEPARPGASWLPVDLVVTEPDDWWRIIHAGTLVVTRTGKVAELRHYRRHSETLKARFIGRNGGSYWHGYIAAAEVATVLVPHQPEQVAP